MFAPIEDGPRLLVDGGVLSNVPTSILRDAGADFIIGSNVVPRSTGDGTKSVFSSLTAHTPFARI